MTTSEAFGDEEDGAEDEGGNSVLSDIGGLDPGKINEITGGGRGEDSGVERGRFGGGGGIGVALLEAETVSICGEGALPASVALLEFDWTGLETSNLVGMMPLPAPLLLLLPLLLLAMLLLPTNAFSPTPGVGTLAAMFSCGTKIND